MGYRSRHTEPSILVRASTRGGVIAAAAALAASGAGFLGAASASAADTPLPVTLSSCGTGSSAVWNDSQQPALTVGTSGAGTCGAPSDSTYNPAYAQVALPGVKGQAVPADQPVFTTDHYASGSPRMEIDLNNGHSLTGYPGASGLNGSDMAWSDDQHPNTYTAYSTVYTESLAYETTTKDAYIVEDADQTPGTTDTIDSIQYDGQSLGAGAVTVTAPGNMTATAGTPVAYQVQAATTSSEQDLTYSAQNLPSGLSIDTSTGKISGTPSAKGAFSSTVTASDAYGQTDSQSFTWTVKAAAICTGACSWERLKAPSSMVMEVKGQTPARNTPVIAHNAQAGDPAADFTLARVGSTGSHQIEYTPYSTAAAATANSPSLAAAAYNSDGTPKYCVSSIADKSGQAMALRSCATTANEWQDFLSFGTGSYRMLEPTYGGAGTSPGSHPMAINDKAYGGNGTPLINYAAIASGNEEFTPGT